MFEAENPNSSDHEVALAELGNNAERLFVLKNAPETYRWQPYKAARTTAAEKLARFGSGLVNFYNPVALARHVRWKQVPSSVQSVFYYDDGQYVTGLIAEYSTDEYGQKVAQQTALYFSKELANSRINGQQNAVDTGRLVDLFDPSTDDTDIDEASRFVTGQLVGLLDVSDRER